LNTKTQTPGEHDQADAELADEELEQVAGGGLVIKPTFVKSWSTSGDADDRPTEEISFNYTKIGG
jgi:hypothetical protein